MMEFTWTYCDCRWWRTETADDVCIPRWSRRFWDATEDTSVSRRWGKWTERKTRKLTAATVTCRDNQKQQQQIKQLTNAEPAHRASLSELPYPRNIWRSPLSLPFPGFPSPLPTVSTRETPRYQQATQLTTPAEWRVAALHVIVARVLFGRSRSLVLVPIESAYATSY